MPASGSPAITEHYRAAFDAFEQNADADAVDGAGLRALRREAIERFARMGLPTRKHEDWRYTNLRELEKVLLSESRTGFDSKPVDAATLASLLPDEPLGPRLVFVDGRLDAALSDAALLGGGQNEGGRDAFSVVALADVRGNDDALAAWLAAGNDDALAAWLAAGGTDAGGDANDDAFACLNAAFVEDGALVTIRRGEDPPRPLHLVFVGTGARGAQHTRLEIVAERGSRGVVVQDHLSLDPRGAGPAFTNAVTRISVEPNATLHHVLIQREAGDRFHVSNTRVRQAADSRFHSHVLCAGGHLLRNALECNLSGPGAEARLDGAFVGGGEQHVENQTLVVHEAPHCESHELYKGVLGGSARGVFRGRVDVRPHAQKTNATQSNPNLLVTDRAEIDSKPQLEIRADDVKCNHGSTVGRLDEDALFFLRARGLSGPAARAMLTEGFAAEVTERFPGEALAAWAGRLLAATLHAPGGALADSLALRDDAPAEDPA